MHNSDSCYMKWENLTNRLTLKFWIKIKEYKDG